VSLEPLVFLDQRRVRIDLPPATLRGQGLERDRIAYYRHAGRCDE
jgi:hypothetical protein